MKPDQIKEIICNEFGIDEFLVSHREERERIPRHTFVYLLRQFTLLSYEDIRDIVGFKNHGSVRYSCKQVGETLIYDYKYGVPILRCQKQCREVIKKEMEALGC